MAEKEDKALDVGDLDKEEGEPEREEVDGDPRLREPCRRSGAAAQASGARIRTTESAAAWTSVANRIR